MNDSRITIQTTIDAPLTKVWDFWTKPEQIVTWAFASDDWEVSAAENDLVEGGSFKTVMAAKDKSAQFDFTGTYTKIEEHVEIEYELDDGRKVRIEFTQTPEGTKVVQVFDPELENSVEKQRQGWQAILDNFKKVVEASGQ